MTNALLEKTPVWERRAEKLVTLAGNPNTGKTTLFNALTGGRYKVGNYPGVTVECREGALRLEGRDPVRLLDIPGAYSLNPQAPDERIVYDVLTANLPGIPRPDAVILIIDASNLSRNLYFATQIVELGVPCVVALNMMDVAGRLGMAIDAEKLSQKIGFPCVPVTAVRGQGLPELKRAVTTALERPSLVDFSYKERWEMPFDLRKEVEALSLSLPKSNGRGCLNREAEALCLIAADPAIMDLSRYPGDVRKKLEGVRTRLDGALFQMKAECIRARYRWIDETIRQTLVTPDRASRTLTDRADAVLTHRLFGPLIFAGVMFALFQAMFTWSGPLVEKIGTLMAWVSDGLSSLLGDTLLADLLTNGIVAGVGNVIVFLPQIAILFLFIGLLEDTGYMARAAFIMDRIMSRAGLNGRSFIPMLSAFACAVPGIMAARTIGNRKDRLATMLISPLMSCSARLPVYTLVIAAVFAANRKVFGPVTQGGLIMTSMYFLGIVAALVMAFVIKKVILKGPNQPFVLELPPYKVPGLKTVLLLVYDNSKAFVLRAGTIILAMTVVLWALLSFPKLNEAERAQMPAGMAQSVQIEQSVAGRIGKAVEPVIAPLGFDWKIGVGLIGAFAAREVFVGTMGVIYGIEGDVDETNRSLRDSLRAETRPDGSRVFTPLTGLSILVYFVLAMQCMSTLSVAKREMGGWGWPLFMLFYMNALAYAASLIVYQGGRVLGFS